MWYHLALFVHILGVLVLFMAVGVELAALMGVRGARSLEQVRTWARAGVGVGRLFPLALVLILAAGLYMTFAAWGIGTGWIAVALVTVLALAVAGPLLNGKRFEALHRAAASAAGDAVPDDVRRRLADPALRIAVYGMAGVSLGVVYLMVMKPDLLGSLVAVAVAGMLGVASALPGGRTRRAEVAAAQVTSQRAEEAGAR